MSNAAPTPTAPVVTPPAAPPVTPPAAEAPGSAPTNPAKAGANTYNVTKSGDVVDESGGGGIDTVVSTVSYDLSDTSKVKGGDLDFFPKGQMVPEFDKGTFSMKVGEISPLVKSQYGYHIIKVTDKKEAATKSLDEVRGSFQAAAPEKDRCRINQRDADRNRMIAAFCFIDGLLCCSERLL